LIGCYRLSYSRKRAINTTSTQEKIFPKTTHIQPNFCKKLMKDVIF
jgi:hypothetical protein